MGFSIFWGALHLGDAGERTNYFTWVEGRGYFCGEMLCDSFFVNHSRKGRWSDESGKILKLPMESYIPQK